MSKKRKVFTAIAMAFCMSLCMSGVMVLVNMGVTPHFWGVWMRSWGIGFVVSLPLAFIVPPAVQKIANQLGL